MPEGFDHPDGEAALELIDACGIVLDPWQQDVFRESLRVRDCRWAAFEVGLVVPRQNGKSELALARLLAGLFVLRERLIVYTAHLSDTAKEMFRRLDETIASRDWLAAEVGHVWRTNGHESIELASGQRIRFRTRTKGGGRGYAEAACVVFDEAMILPEASIGAILPIVSASANPQIWYAGSAVDQSIHDDGLALARIRERGTAGDDPSLAYFEWSVEGGSPEDLEPDSARSAEAWAQANPALGIRIALEHVANEYRSMDHRTFAVERLGVGDWPSVNGDSGVIDLEKWEMLADPEPFTGDPACFAFDTAPDRSWSTIGVCGRRDDGFWHVEVVDRRHGVGWMVQRLEELHVRYPSALFVCDGIGPVGSLIPRLEQDGVKVSPVTSTEHGRGCGMFYDAVEDGTLRHLGTPELRSAVRGATQRTLGEAWAWSRRNSSVDISPLVACTLALWGAATAVETEAWLAVW
ncbi:MAG TPA: hypothetical protein VMT43_06410 [Acidimicrobiales bacterium]|nr:hypothetical protein [Acidimicrobiales bacterium]